MSVCLAQYIERRRCGEFRYIVAPPSETSFVALARFDSPAAEYRGLIRSAGRVYRWVLRPCGDQPAVLAVQKRLRPNRFTPRAGNMHVPPCPLLDGHSLRINYPHCTYRQLWILMRQLKKQREETHSASYGKEYE